MFQKLSGKNKANPERAKTADHAGHITGSAAQKTGLDKYSHVKQSVLYENLECCEIREVD